MTLCVGIDYSTSRVDLAAIDLDPDIDRAPRRTRFGVSRIGAPSDLQRPIDYQGVRRDLLAALRELELDADPVPDNVATVLVEAPAGKVHPNLRGMFGALLASVPSRMTVGSIYPVQWRTALGRQGRDTKAAGAELVRAAWPIAADWDEHELDALGIATAWRMIQWKAADEVDAWAP